MMQFFRKLGNTKASRIFLGILTLSFVGWGVSGYLVKVSGSSAVTVGDTEISVQQVDEVYKQKLNMLTQALGHAPTADELAQTHIAEDVLNDLVARAVLRENAQELGLVAPVKALQEEIGSSPMFKNDKGVFDAARYKEILARAGRSPEQFESEMAQDLSVRLLGDLVKVASAADAALAPQAALENATLELEIASIPASLDAGLHEPSAEELKRHYDLNQKLYEKPEKRSFTILELSRKNVAATVSIPDTQIEKEYNDNKANFSVPEKRDVRHILVETEDKAKQIAANIHSEADFIKEANAESKDPGNAGGKGGDLGAIAKDSVVPEFGNTAFSLPVGQLSKPVKSAYGWHLIWVTKVEPAHTQTFDEAKASIEEQLKNNEVDDALNTLAKQVDERIAAGDDLTKVAKRIGLTAEPVAMVTAKDQSTPAEYVQAAFGTEMGQVSAPINLKDGGEAFVQVTAVTPAEVPALAEIKDRVVADWKNVQKQLAAQQAADKVLTAVKMQSTRSVTDSVAQAAVPGVQISKLTVKDLKDVPEWLHPALLGIFQLPEGATLGQVVAGNDGYHVVRLTKRTLAKPDAAALASNAKQFQQRLQADVEALVVAQMQHNASINCHQDQLRQVFGRDIACGN